MCEFSSKNFFSTWNLYHKFPIKFFTPTRSSWNARLVTLFSSRFCHFILMGDERFPHCVAIEWRKKIDEIYRRLWNNFPFKIVLNSYPNHAPPRFNHKTFSFHLLLSYYSTEKRKFSMKTKTTVWNRITLVSIDQSLKTLKFHVLS